MIRSQKLCTLALVAAMQSAVAGAEEDFRMFDSEIITLSELRVETLRPANTHPAGSYATTTTQLRFLPFIDLQSRGFAEAQSDVTVRGGIFENTGFKVGALNLFDPQTGHYFAELPIDPDMLGTPYVITGVANAVAGFNSNVATVVHDWRPITPGGVAEVGAGTDSLLFGRVLVSGAISRNHYGQISISHSEGDGSIDFGDHKFTRYSARYRKAWTSGGSTDLYIGHQEKFFGWPGMYTGNPSYPETDQYEVTLVAINHHQEYDKGWWAAAAYYRGLDNDYELDRLQPGYFRPYIHTTKVYSAAVEGDHRIGQDLSIQWRAEAIADEIESTELTHAGFMSRSYGKISILPAYTFNLEEERSVIVAAGATADSSNRDNSSVSPQLSLTYKQNNLRLFVEYARATQLAGYTALGSAPEGSFGGNPDLIREVANNYEVGAEWSRNRLHLYAAFFYREDHNLTDWTYFSEVPRFRQANPVDLETIGFETFAAYSFENPNLRLLFSYAFLEKQSDYGSADVDASFYALNFPEHRATVAVQWNILPTLEIAMDLEARCQEQNIRRTSDTETLLVAGSITWHPESVTGLSLSLIGDNLTNSNFQEFPGTPADGRQLAVKAAYSW